MHFFKVLKRLKSLSMNTFRFNQQALITFFFGVEGWCKRIDCIILKKFMVEVRKREEGRGNKYWIKKGESNRYNYLKLIIETIFKYLLSKCTKLSALFF